MPVHTRRNVRAREWIIHLSRLKYPVPTRPSGIAISSRPVPINRPKANANANVGVLMLLPFSFPGEHKPSGLSLPGCRGQIKITAEGER